MNSTAVPPPTMARAPQVLIVGAGPVGLTLACDLAWRGVPLRIIDSNPKSSQHSKAIGVFPRTLELLENHEVAEEMVRSGVRVEALNIHDGHRRLAHIDTRRIASHYNFILTLEQSETERLLLRRLKVLGVQVERCVRLISLEGHPDHVHATLDREGAERESLSVPWVVGCDGAHSFVRDSQHISFHGERYSEAFDLADVHLSAVPEESKNSIFVFLSTQGVVFAAPLASGQHRLIVDEPPGSADERRGTPSLDEFRAWWRKRVSYPSFKHAHLTDDTWRKRFTIQRRMVKRLRQGRVLLAGDAAHVHSPAGAQGMNGGIQDALNLAWKLALVVQERAPESLLDTYGQERLPVARRVLTFTHLLTHGLTQRNPVVWAVRGWVMSLVINRAIVQRTVVNVAAGLRTNYRTSPIVRSQRVLKAGHSSTLTGGDRAPDVLLTGGKRLYDVLRHPSHTLLVFTGTRSGEQAMQGAVNLVERISARYGELVRVQVVVTHRGLPFAPRGALVDVDGIVHASYGLRDSGVCLIRPDRYVALCAPAFGEAGITEVLEQVLLTGRKR